MNIPSCRQIPWRDTRQKKKDRLPMPLLIGSVLSERGWINSRERRRILEIGSQFELEHWRNRLFVHFEDIADLLLPSRELIQKKVERPKQRKLAAVDPYDL
jgi:hypothetical protein